MEYNFNRNPNDAVGFDEAHEGKTGTPEPGTDIGAGGAEAGQAAPGAPAQAEAGPGLKRFQSCRWQQPAENGSAEFCTHREVKPYAGTAGFDAEAWCPDCQYYKLRRTPKKRTPSDDYLY
ncbi:MAG: hypothetical protein AB7G23_09805 [Vicinamibacterales bacterium]